MNAISLFSGCLGLDLGLEAAGWNILWACESDKACRRVIERQRPGLDVLEDVRAIDPGMPRAELLAGGFPCQDLSHAGAGAGLTGDRSALWFAMADAIRLLRPRLVLIENVPGLATKMGARPGESALGTVIADLAEAGYVGSALRLRAADVGACHLRERIFLVASREGEAEDGGAFERLRRWRYRRGRVTDSFPVWEEALRLDSQGHREHDRASSASADSAERELGRSAHEGTRRVGETASSLVLDAYSKGRAHAVSLGGAALLAGEESAGRDALGLPPEGGDGSEESEWFNDLGRESSGDWSQDKGKDDVPESSRDERSVASDTRSEARGRLEPRSGSGEVQGSEEPRRQAFESGRRGRGDRGTGGVAPPNTEGLGDAELAQSDDAASLLGDRTGAGAGVDAGRDPAGVRERGGDASGGTSTPADASGARRREESGSASRDEGESAGRPALADHESLGAGSSGLLAAAAPDSGSERLDGRRREDAEGTSGRGRSGRPVAAGHQPSPPDAHGAGFGEHGGSVAARSELGAAERGGDASPPDADGESGQPGSGGRASSGADARGGSTERVGSGYMGPAEPWSSEDAADADRIGRRLIGVEEREDDSGASWDIPDRRDGEIEWGVYEPAIRNWEYIFGRRAPHPTDDRGRLSPEFVEWMMGFPEGWTEGESRTARLRMLGNAVHVQVGEVMGWILRDASDS